MRLKRTAPAAEWARVSQHLMRPPTRRSARLLAGVAIAATVIGGGLLTAPPAQAAGAAPRARAAVADAGTGVPLTRSQILARAYTWTTAQVPYSQTDYWPASAPRTGPGHGYRQDCSGFLSMAWALPTSAVTGDFVSRTSLYDTPLASWDQLAPGDLLGVSSHIVLFLGWSADDAGRHRFFDLASESTYGRPAAVYRDQDRQGYWWAYAPYRYKHVVETVPVVAMARHGFRFHQPYLRFRR